MTLKLVSCNIRFDNPSDGANAWPHRKDFLVETLKKYNPDIIATQEGRFDQLKEFESLLGDFELLDFHRSWIKERMYPCIFIKKNTFEYSQSGDLWLSETPDVAGSRSFESAFPRLMTWTRLQVKNSETAFYVVNTHLDHVKEETRIHQIQVLADQINRFWDKNKPLIIMGDFNDGPDSKIREIFNQNFKGLQDSWKLFNNQETTSHHAFHGEMQNGARIDWIMVDERIKIEKCLMDKTMKNGHYPTDHFPIICEIKF